VTDNATVIRTEISRPAPEIVKEKHRAGVDAALKGGGFRG